MKDIITTTISELDGVPILNIHNNEGIYIYYKDEVRFVLISNIKLTQGCSIIDILKNKPEEKIYIYSFEHISGLRTSLLFDNIIEKMKELTLNIQRDKKLKELGI